MQRLAKSCSGRAQASGDQADGARVPLCTGAEANVHLTGQMR